MIPLRLSRQESSNTHRNGSRDELGDSSDGDDLGRAETTQSSSESERDSLWPVKTLKLLRLREMIQLAIPSEKPMTISLTTSGEMRERSSSPLSSLQQIVRSTSCIEHFAAKLIEIDGKSARNDRRDVEE